MTCMWELQNLRHFFAVHAVYGKGKSIASIGVTLQKLPATESVDQWHVFWWSKIITL